MTSESTALCQERFGRWARTYVDRLPRAVLANLDRLVALAQPRPDWVMLDVATGMGHTALRFAPHVAHITAVDITRAVVKAAAQRLLGKGVVNVGFQQLDAQAMPFHTASFDLVTCRIAPHHFDNVEAFVRETARVLKPGGTLLVQDNLVPGNASAARYVDALEKLRDPSHNRAYSEREWLAMLVEAGLTVTHVEPLNWPFHFETWAARQEVTPSTKASLVALIDAAPEPVRAWLQPEAWGTPDAAFTYRLVIVKGTKP